ncbi:MAG: hypothetical protein QOK00_1596 [Thermoleophilaceae bacterium]|nr:hypothetical protein [Thermoleophilaceae bacterium]MEA2456950.1 hypothetical protein [Thermoleophilaceae bacterium]
MQLRPLVRAAPFVLGAVAAGVWLHRRGSGPPALRERTGELPPPVPPERRFQRPVRARFARAAARRPIDIVTIVDDLLGATR